MQIHGRWLLLLAGCLASGCVSGPMPEKAAWPWEDSKKYGECQTEDYIAVRGNVASFGEPPKATKPVSHESVSPSIPDSSISHQAPSAKTAASLSPIEKKEGVSRIETETDYVFTVQNLKIQPPSYLPVETTRSVYDVTAFNNGNAPVSVILHLDQFSSENFSIDKVLPVSAVVPPHTDRGLLQLRPQMKNSPNFRYSYSWSLGDYTASHDCPEHYRFPFSKNVRVFAHVTDTADSTPFTRNAVIFSMPVDTPVFAARKGTVIRRAKNKLDILHDDSTIATYSHVGKITDDIVAGKVVSTEDVIGTAGAVDSKEAYIQLTVWRPEAPPAGSATSASPNMGFALVSFPLEFCSRGSNECRILTQSQWLSQDNVAEAKKQRKTKPKPGNKSK